MGYYRFFAARFYEGDGGAHFRCHAACSEVTFGLQDLGRQLRRWREIHDYGQQKNKSLASLDLAVTNNIPARWLQVSTGPVTAPKAPKTLRTKRKNV